MSTQIHDAVYCPDVDSARVRGALVSMTGFAPLQRGQYGSVSTNDVFAITGTDALRAETFRQIDNSVRLLVFRKQRIDEYTSAGANDAVGTGYSASTTGWDAAAWGNSIYACNKLDATQVSTGTTFAAVGDDCPKARYIAANINFVMLADTDDGADDLPDQVWWSALQNPTEWTPSIATQAGKVRLLDAPGPIKQLVAFRDLFVAFKEDAIFVGEYIGPPFMFQWRVVSSRIGLSSPNAVCELDNRLYFAHMSGIYEFDGAELRNVGLPVWPSIRIAFGNDAPPYGTGMGGTGEGYEATAIDLLRMTGDDHEGVLWLSCYRIHALSGDYQCVLFGYNVRSQKWARLDALPGLSELPQVLVNTTQSDMRAFLGAAMNAQARAWYVDAYLSDLRYPDAWGNDLPGQITTAVEGDPQKSSDALRIYVRCLYGSDSAPFSGGTIYGYANEQRTVGSQTATCVLNAELDCFDGRLSAKYKMVTLVGDRAKSCILAGVGIDYPLMSAR